MPLRRHLHTGPSHNTLDGSRITQHLARFSLGLTREQVAVALAVAVVWLGFDFAIPFLPLYIRELGVTSASEAALWAGILISMGPGLGAVVSPFWGMMADRYGHRAMMIRSLTAFTLLLALTGLVVSLWQLVVLRFGLGILGGFAPLAFAMMIASGPRSSRPQALGVLQAAQFLPLALGPLVGGIIADSFGLRVNFFVGAALNLGALILLAVLLKRPPAAAATPSVGEQPRAEALREVIRSKGFALPFGLLFIAYFVERSFLPILPLYVAELGTPTESVATSAGMVLAAGAVTVAVSGPLLGRLATRYPLQRLLTVTLGCGVALLLLIALAQNYTQLLVLRVALALLAGGLPTLAFSLGTLTAAQGTLGRRTGLLTTAMQLANASGPLAAGLIASWRLEAVFIADAILLGLALVGVLFLLRSGGEGATAAAPARAPSPES